MSDEDDKKKDEVAEGIGKMDKGDVILDKIRGF